MDIHQFEPLWESWYIQKPIGSGSFGTVYMAQETDLVGYTDKCAVKHLSIPRDEAELESLKHELKLYSDQDIDSFLYDKVQSVVEEYETLRQFNGHPNFVQVYNKLVRRKKDIPGYDVFIRMELLNSIDTRFKSGSVNEQEVIRLGIDICTALAEMHKRGFIHRDIKPQNILVSRDGVYKLSDFGSVRKVSGAATTMTMKGAFLYTAPEILNGSPADKRVDICSLGYVMYQLLSKSKPPEIKLPGKKLTFPQSISPGLADIVLKACEYYSDKRWNNATEMLEALQQLIKSNKVENLTASVLSTKDSGKDKTAVAEDTVLNQQNQSASGEINIGGDKISYPDKKAKNDNSAKYDTHPQGDVSTPISSKGKTEKSKKEKRNLRISVIAVCVVLLAALLIYLSGKIKPTLYTITWLDDTGNVIDTAEYAYGTLPEHSDPIKEADVQYSYTFSDWSPAIERVTADAIYKATYSPVTNKYTITWQDDAGNVIDTAEYAYGTVPEHSDPIKEADAQYSYTFSGWSPDVEKVTDNAVYKATYSPATNKYTITWQDDTGSVIDTTEYAYGIVPEHSDPIKEADAQYSYIFSGWSPAVEKVTDNAVYNATYSPVTNKYTITWQDDAGNVIDTAEYAYGTVPKHSDPIKETDVQYSYIFSGWTPDVEKVTGDAVYKATYSSVTNNYTITWQDDTGNVIDTAEYAYGTLPSHDNPTKSSDGRYTYTFIGWTPNVEMVIGDATYKAEYSIEVIPTPIPTSTPIPTQAHTPTPKPTPIPTATPIPQPANTLASGEWGTCNWWIDQEGTLVITQGTGSNTDNYQPAPWKDRAEKIHAVTTMGYVTAPENCSYLFSNLVNCTKINLNSFNTSSVNNMGSMFRYCESLSSLDLGGFDTSNVTNMRFMFSGCTNLISLNLSSFNTSRVTDKAGILSVCYGLKTLVLGPKCSFSDSSNYLSGTWKSDQSNKSYPGESLLKSHPQGTTATYTKVDVKEEFISRCYQCILGRNASQAELDSWIGQMTNGTKSPDQIARGFLFSEEFKSKSVSNEELVKIIYRVYMNREADPVGLAAWTEKLNGGTALKDLLDAFTKASEYKKAVSDMGL